MKKCVYLGWAAAEQGFPPGQTWESMRGKLHCTGDLQRAGLEPQRLRVARETKPRGLR